MNECETPKITAILPWFGSKRSLAELIVQELGPHKSYWNPCCGSFAVEMVKPVSAQETCNDMHDELMNLARVLQHPQCGPQLYRRLRRLWFHEGLFNDAKSRIESQHESVSLFGFEPRTEISNVDRAFFYFMISWVGRNGCAGLKRCDFSIALRWTSGGGSGSTRLKNAVDSIPAWRRRLRHITMLQRDMFDILAKIEDEPGTVIYVDPPYIRDGVSRSGNAQYQHEFKSGDHYRLALALRRFQNVRVVVSYYTHSLLGEIYPGWTVVDCARQKNLHVQNRRGVDQGMDAPEILLINGPSFTA